MKKDKRTGLQPHTQKCVFIEYPSEYKGWRCWSPETKEEVISNSIKFDERFFPGNLTNPLKWPLPPSPSSQNSNSQRMADQGGVESDDDDDDQPFSSNSAPKKEEENDSGLPPSSCHASSFFRSTLICADYCFPCLTSFFAYFIPFPDLIHSFITCLPCLVTPITFVSTPVPLTHHSLLPSPFLLIRCIASSPP